MWGLHKFHFLFEIKYVMCVKNTCHDGIISLRGWGGIQLVWSGVGFRPSGGPGPIISLRGEVRANNNMVTHADLDLVGSLDQHVVGVTTIWGM